MRQATKRSINGTRWMRLLRRHILKLDFFTVQPARSASFAENLSTASIVARILWFQIAFVLLDGASPAPFPGRLKTALQAEGAHMDWTMDPVLAHLQPKLSPEAHALLTALVAALSDPANLAKLDDYPEWRAAAALPLA